MPSQTVRIGLTCNEGCLYCFADPEMWADRPLGWGKDYSNLIGKDWRRELREIRQAGYDGLSISGGEPLLYPDLVKMVKYARLLGFGRVELQSNATLLTEENSRRLARAGICSALISLPSHEERIYDAITATKGYHQAAMTGLKNFLSEHIHVTLCHVVCTANYRFLPEYVDYVADNFPQIQRISFLYVQPEGRGRQNPSLYPDLDDLRPYWEEAMARCDARGVGFSTDVQTGLPLCMMTGHEERVDLGLLLSPDDFWGDDLSSFEYMQSHKRQGEACGSCFFQGVCYGFWNEYLDAYGDEGLRPVVEAPRLRELYPQVAAGAVAPRVEPGEERSRMIGDKGIRRMPAAKSRASSPAGESGA